MTLWQCYYHIIWATKNRDPLIAPQYEPIIFEAIKRKSEELKCHVLAVNGMWDHVHVAVSIPPTVAVVDWVKNVKGVSSREFNTTLPSLPARFRWQDGSNILTVGPRHLEMVVNYVRNQKQHHANNKLYDYLERSE